MIAKHTRPRRSLHSFNLPAGVLTELRSEAKRLGLTYSQMAQRAWLIARESIGDMPDAEGEK